MGPLWILHGSKPLNSLQNTLKYCYGMIWATDLTREVSSSLLCIIAGGSHHPHSRWLHIRVDETRPCVVRFLEHRTRKETWMAIVEILRSRLWMKLWRGILSRGEEQMPRRANSSRRHFGDTGYRCLIFSPAFTKATTVSVSLCIALLVTRLMEMIRISVKPKNPSGRLMRSSCRVLKKRSNSINGHWKTSGTP